MTLVLAIVSLAAAAVTGALGYGYSSITVPIALLVITNRVLNPALVVIEVGVNSCTAVLNRRAIRAIAPRVVFAALGVVPGIVLGTLLLSSFDAPAVKLQEATT